MSNISLAGNNGTSINFDGAALQSKEEDEYRKEEEQQQNELRALLTNAFDDLIDEDDILSITSEEGTDSRNVSLIRRHSNDSLNKLNTEENKIHELPENDSEFSLPSASSTQVSMPFAAHQQPKFGQHEPLSRTQELPRGQLDLLRASVESLPNFPFSRDRFDIDVRSSAGHFGREQQDSDYHSSIDDQQKIDFRGHVYPPDQGQASKVKGQGEGHQRVTLDNSKDTGSAKQKSDRDNMLRQSMEDFQQVREAYEQQQQEQYYGSHGNQAVHNQYHSAEQPYDQVQGQAVQGQLVHHDQGQYYHGHEPVQHHDYDPHYHHHHHHFRNIYQNRPYHTIGEREETEGGNVTSAGDPQYYGMHPGYTMQNHHGYYHDTMATQDQDSKAAYRRDYSTGYSTTDHGFYSQATGPSETQPVTSQSSGHRKLPPDPRKEGHGHLNDSKREHHRGNKGQSSSHANKKDVNRDKGLQQAQNRKEFKDNYKVNYKRDMEGMRESVDSSVSSEHNLDKEFMDQGGDNQQLAQLQILYKARGSKIEELKNELEVVKGESARDIRIMKHQLSVAKGEREGASQSLESVQELLQGTRSDNTQLQGKVKASEAQIEALKTAKEELIKKLKTAESNIETLHQHLEDLGSSDTLTRARHDHELVVSGLQKKYETEIKHLQEQTEKLNEKLQEKDSEVAILQQKLSDAVKQSERDQISRADTINRLSQSLEDSQKRCRNLLETTTSQDMSQMKVQLQQALASKSISDEICSSLQDEVQDLKEQVQMLESASALGVSSTGHTQSAFTDQNDSMADLGIKKTLDYDTPQGTPTINRSQSSTSSEVVSSLKAELERCLVSNRQKRLEVNDLKEELKKVKKDMLEYKQRCEGAELQAQEQKKRIADLEYCLNPGEKINAIENRLKKDIDNLKKEKKILLEDVEDLQKRLEEVSQSEVKLTELNRELSQQISDMVKEYDQDRRQAIDRTQRACEQVSETSRSKLRQELEMQFDAERANIIAKYEKEVSKLCEDLKTAQDEADKVKDVYVQLCEEKDKLHDHMEKEWTEKMEKNIEQVTQSLKKEEELSLLRAEENWEKLKEQELAKLKDELEQDKENTVDKLKQEFTSEMKTAQEKFENELKTIKDIMEIEKSNELEKANKEKLNEIEKLKTLVSEKDKMLDSIRTDNSGLVDMLKSELEVKITDNNNLKAALSEKEAYIETLRIESEAEIEKLRCELDEKLNEVERLTCDIGEKANLMEKLTGEMKFVASNKAGLEEKNKEIEQLKQHLNTVLTQAEEKRTKEIEKLKQHMDSMLAQAQEEKIRDIEKLKQDMESLLKDKEAEIESLKKDMEQLQGEKVAEVDQLKKDIEKIHNENETKMEQLKKDLQKVEKEKDAQIDKLQHGDAEKEDAGNLRIEIVKNMQKEKQQEVEQLKKEVIRLKLEIDRNETDKQLEIDKVCRVKQAEIENIEKRRQAELDRFKKEKRMEMDRLKKEKDDQINRLKRVKEDRRDEDDLTDRVREKLNKEMEEDLNRSLETKVAMSKVVWLEEHRATRQAAIDNAVRLAESELRLKMEEELEAKLEQRLEEAKIMWQSDSLQHLDDERQNWESLKEEELKDRLEKQHQVWRNTELEGERLKWLSEYEQRLESERQKWLSDFEEQLEEEKKSWRDTELETEKLQWTLDWEKKLQQAQENWHKNILEPAKRKWKHEAEDKLRKEKDNWRCMELEPEKLNLMRELEERLLREKQTWLKRDLPAEIEKERKRFEAELTKRIEKKQTEWRNEELQSELQRERQVWYAEMEKKLTEQKNNWKNSDLPEEIEKERRKWMKLMETTLAKEKENWIKQDLPAEVKKTKQELEKSMESEVESKLLEKLEIEKQRLQKDSETKVLEAIEEHQEACKKELQAALDTEKERLRDKYEHELQERFQAEKKIWKNMVDQEASQKLEIEKEKWKRKAESDYNKKLETEKDKMKSWIRKDLEKRMEEDKENMKEDFEREFKNKLNDEINRLRDKYDNEAREDFNHMKAKIEGDAKQDFEHMKMQLEEELQMNLEKEKELLQVKADRELTNKLETEKEALKLELEKEMSEKLQSEKDQWKSDFEKELGEKLQTEEGKWKEMIENDIENRLKQERDKWESKKYEDFKGHLEEEKKRWEDQKLEDMRTLSAQYEDRMRSDMDEEVEKLRVQVEHEFHHRVEHEVSLAVQEARDDWLREYTMEMSINTTSAEASQGLLKEEIDSLKQKVESLQAELRQKEEAWLKEKEDLILQKDLDRREALESIQNQTEAEYKQFITEHQDTLDKALKASREQHNRDKCELEERYLSQIKLIQAREKALQSQLHESLQGTEVQCSTLAELEKERIVWYEERDRLLQDIADRDSLLGKADVHLSKEIDKLRTELQAAYQRRLESDMASFKQKIESEFNRANNSEQKEKLQLEKQLSEVNTELIKVKNLHSEESSKLTEEVKSLKEKLNEHEKKIEEYNRLEGELKKAKELLKGYKDELSDNQDSYQKYRTETEELQIKLAKSLQHQEILQTELQKLQDEKTGIVESVKSIETSYRKDLALYKQKQEEANTRILKTEQILMDMKHKYRSELESLRKALEAENDVAMNAMKNKMIELQKKHVAILEEVKKKHVHEKEEILKGKVARGLTPQPATGEVEDIDKAVKELRTQYLDTVHKIKGDVLRHITETNVRAAETVKLEMDRERSCTFNQIKEFYRQNVKQILETEIVGANLETKLLAVEEALDNMSSNPSSRSATPKSDEFLIDERPVKSRSRSLTRDSYNRDAGISPKNQRTVTFTTGMRGRDDRSKTPVNQNANASVNSTGKSDVSIDDPRSPKSRLFTRPHSSTRDWVYSSSKDASFDTRHPDNRPVSARSHRELREEDYTTSERPLSAKSPRELHLSLREKSGRLENEDYTPRSDRDASRNSDKRKSRMLISTRDIHSGRYSRAADEDVAQVPRSKSVTSVFNAAASLYRPTSVPDLSSSEDKELKVWTETNNDSYRYTPLRDTLKSGTNLHRSNSKSESDLSIAEKNFGTLKPEYDSNLDLSTGSLTSIDSFFTPRKRRDAGETPTSTPRRHVHRKHYTMHSFPTNEQLSKELQGQERSGKVSVSSPLASHQNQRERKNLPLIQFRHGKMQNLARVGVGNSKSPHPEEPVLQRDTPPTRDTSNSNDRHYRPLSVSSTVHMDF